MKIQVFFAHIWNSVSIAKFFIKVSCIPFVCILLQHFVIRKKKRLQSPKHLDKLYKINRAHSFYIPDFGFLLVFSEFPIPFASFQNCRNSSNVHNGACLYVNGDVCTFGWVWVCVCVRLDGFGCVHVYDWVCVFVYLCKRQLCAWFHALFDFCRCNPIIALIPGELFKTFAHQQNDDGDQPFSSESINISLRGVFTMTYTLW